ncbi:hypothetical protein K501DRAFT_91345 [Backusella circina FSU 941]|nr:hypothetical protein K501DRAFT_91345 [Backusella circina FSU 941]
MSHNQARTFPSHGFSNMPTTAIPRQQIMNQPFQPGGPSPTLSHPSGSNAVSPSSTPRNSSSTTITHSLNGPSSSNSGTSVSAPATQETMYCDSCQTFRHVAFFNERDFKYGICTLCQNREVQKRKQQLERYEMYEEQQRKQARYQMQYATAPQLTPSHPIQSQIHSPISLGHAPASSPQIKQSSPSIVPTLSSQINPTKPLFSSPMRNQTQMQPNLHQQMIQALPTQDIQPTTSNTTTTPSTSATSTPSAVTVAHQPLPQRHEKRITMNTSISRTSQHMDRQSQEVITLDMFINLLERETEFDRKQYHLDISPLMETMGEGAGFTQLGRGICEHVLKGTKFNFRIVVVQRKAQTLFQRYVIIVHKEQIQQNQERQNTRKLRIDMIALAH